ncbi:DUF1697 domain-containing protein [Aestuariivivens sediminis]|uniref:DUF1697 domain-containing protein n=1 Tax=Aestuariivivens sediminis TaxID=2913557 RepID=UPI001F59F32D|nr:DUF1697 domain-containing protein [Aestuariivivens sediminis]
MNTYIALLRGINVSGQKKIPMSVLRELWSSLGFQKVRTYIQSGNVCFQCMEDDSEALKIKIQDAIKSEFHFEVPVLLKTPQALDQIFNACPFVDNEKTNSYFILLYHKPDQILVDELLRFSSAEERFVITEQCIYFYSSLGYGKSKFNTNFFERKLNVTATARNYKTMLKLLSLSAEN